MKLFITLIKYISLTFGLLCFFSHIASARVMEKKPLWAEPIDTSFNFYQVTPFLYRSALPNPTKVDLLKKYRVDTIITFIDKNDEKWLRKDTGIKLVSYPVHADRVKDDDVLYVLKIVEQSQRKGNVVLMHCKHGQNRTGLFAAMYRIVIQDWTKEQAILELARGGYSDDLSDIDEAIAYIKEANVKKIRYALQNNECSTRRFAFCHLFN